MKKPRSAFELAYNKYIRGKPRMEAGFKEEMQRLELTAWLRDLRESAGLTQTEMARRVGTTPSVISRLEDPDYEGHSLKTLQRFVAALGMSLQLAIVPLGGKRRKASSVVLVPPPLRTKRVAG